MNKTARGCLLLLAMGLLVLGCKTTASISGDTRRISAKEVLAKMKKAEVDYKTLSAKLKIEYEGGEDKEKFKGNLRVVRDSAIWMSVSPLFGLEVARFLITADSIKFIDRVNKQFIAEPISRAESIYNAPVNFRILESLISGKLAFDDLKVKNLDADSSHYFLTLQSDDIDAEITINGGSFLADAMDVHQKASNRRMHVNYDNYEKVDTQYFSHQRQLQLEAEKDVNVSLEFSRVRFGREVNIVFVVPDNYERVR